ncbi:hypothetical protein B0H19DRAFT_1241481, partial [Mycena capillaripes]
MPKSRKSAFHTQRDASGAFCKTTTPITDTASDTDSVAWEDTDLESDPADVDYPEQWQGLRPTTYDERLAQRASKREKAEAKRMRAEMRSAEQRLAGPMDKQTGKKRGKYSVGGMSTRTAQDKRKKLTSDYTQVVVARFSRYLNLNRKFGSAFGGEQARSNAEPKNLS